LSVRQLLFTQNRGKPEKRYEAMDGMWQLGRNLCGEISGWGGIPHGNQ